MHWFKRSYNSRLYRSSQSNIISISLPVWIILKRMLGPIHLLRNVAQNLAILDPY